MGTAILRLIQVTLGPIFEGVNETSACGPSAGSHVLDGRFVALKRTAGLSDWFCFKLNHYPYGKAPPVFFWRLMETL